MHELTASSRARCLRYDNRSEVQRRQGTSFFLNYSQKASWEPYATLLANAETDDALFDTYKKLISDLRISESTPARVIFGRDTRASGSRLVSCLVDALEATGAELTDYKILTTPQLHYLVRCANTQGTSNAYGELSEKGYYEKLGDAFKRAMKHKKANGPVTVDCANGVGGPKLREFLKYLPSKDEGVEIKVVNDDVHKPENLNVQVSEHLPPPRMFYSRAFHG